MRGALRLCCTRLCALATDTGSGIGVWPAARLSDGRLFFCCVMDCWPVRWCGLRRPAVGTQVMAVQLDSSVHCIFRTFQMFGSRQHFWSFGTTAIRLDSIICLLQFLKLLSMEGLSVGVSRTFQSTTLYCVRSFTYLSSGDACHCRQEWQLYDSERQACGNHGRTPNCLLTHVILAGVTYGSSVREDPTSRNWQCMTECVRSDAFIYKPVANCAFSLPRRSRMHGNQ